MKKILHILMILLAGFTLLQSCGSDVELPVLTEEEYPRILGRWPEKLGSALGMMRGYTDVEFTHNVQFTPSNLCEGVWYVNDEKYSRGNTFSYTTENAGEYHIKLIVNTPKYSTSREMILVIQESKKD